MKRTSIFLFLALQIISTFISGQVIDSVMVWTYQSSNSYYGLRHQYAWVDSFSNGLRIDSVRFDANWNPIAHAEYAYDANLNLVEHSIKKSSGAWDDTIKYIFGYDLQNHKTDEYVLIDQTFDSLSHKFWIYDSLDRVSEYYVESYDLTNNVWDTTYNESYHYDSNSRLILKESFGKWPSSWMPIQKNMINYQGNFRADTLFKYDTLQSAFVYSKLLITYSDSIRDTSIVTLNYDTLTMSWSIYITEVYRYPNPLLLSYSYIRYLGDYQYEMAGDAYHYDSTGLWVSWSSLTPGLCHPSKSLRYYPDRNLHKVSGSSHCPNSDFTYLETYYYGGVNSSQVILPENIYLCREDTVPIGAQLATLNPNPQLQFQWTPSTGLSSDTVLNPYLFADTTTQYTLVVQDNTGHRDTFELDVFIRSARKINIVQTDLDSISPCFNFKLSIDSASIYPNYYKWYLDGIEIADGNQSAKSVWNNRNGQYVLYGEFTSGCIGSDTLDINYMPEDSSLNIIKNTCSNFLAINSPNGSLYNWHYTFPSGITGDISNDTLFLNSFGLDLVSVFASVRDSALCYHYLKPISVRGKPVSANQLINECTSCSSGGFISVNPFYAPYQFYWSTGDTTSCTNCSYSQIQNLCPGSYWVTSVDSEGCSVTKPFDVLLSSSSTLNVIYSTSADTLGACNGSITVSATSSDTLSLFQACINNNCGTFQNDTTFQNLCAGEYRLQVSNPGCWREADTLFVDSVLCNLNVNTINTTCIGCANGAITLLAGSTSSYSISINPPSGNILNDSIVNLIAGVYEVCLNDSNGCSSCEIVTILDDPTTILQMEFNNFSIFPNPITDYVTVLANSYENSIFEISDVSGRVLLIADINSEKTIIPINELNEGVYIATIRKNRTEVYRSKIAVVK
ncbi:MAG: T9SS type A sorting domain-containing protein [Bacteroidia bacterium]|nr:T9SS type A sorting domain-containing protein [Bacteroidia bacterium]